MPEETPRKAKRQSPSLKARAVRYLSRREYSRLELEKKLRAYLAEDESEDDLTAVLNDLEQKGYLSDERFAQSRARVRAARYGNARVAYELKASGVSSELIANAIEQLEETEAERAKALWQKRFGKPAEDYKERAKQMRYLLARGFSMEVARQVVRADDFEDL